jgi:3-oxoacyl-[acyl-carrier protein] reductase
MNDDPVAWVTGASGTLGRRVADALLAKGWRVIASSRRTHPTPHPLLKDVPLDVCEVRNPEAFEALKSAWGRLDALVSCAAFSEDDLVMKVSDDAWTQSLAVNLKAAAFCANAAARLMAETGGGSVIHVGSYAGRTGSAGQTAYASAKAALAGLATSQAREWASENIRVNVVLPGVFLSGITKNLPTERIQALARSNLLGRLNDPGEVADFVGFLLKMKNVSGQCFQLDSRIAPWW